jgi:4-amino-4-deoxy-L-arabinose transferase-like glycosyltransferase
MRRRDSSAQPKPRDLAILLFALPMLVYLLSGPVFYGYDGEIMYRVSESLVLRHSIVITDPIYHYTQPYSPYGIATSLALLPFVALGQLLMHDPRALVILYLPIVTALTVVALNAVLVELGITRLWAAALSLIFAFGTMAWHYSGVMFSEPLLALMMVLALLGVLRFRRTGQMRWMLTAGSASGVALLVRDDSLFLVLVPFAIYAALVVMRRNPSWARRARGALAWLIPIGAAGLFALAYHLVRYGSGSGPYANDGMGFTQPLLGGLYGLLLSPGAGLLVFVPVLALAFFGFPEFSRRWRAEASLIAALVVLRFLFFARWWDWQGGATWGPRYLVPLIPLMLLPVAFLRAGWWRQAALALGVLGVGIEVLDQLVPYGLYYGAIVPQLAARLGICECVPGPGQGTRAIHNIMAFDWHYAPLVGQASDLLHGILAPAWAPIAALALPLLAITAVGLGFQIWRLARRLEAVEMAEAA